MEIVQANVRHIYLHFIFTSSSLLPILIKLLLMYLKEALFDLLLYFRFELFLHVVHFKILSFKVLQRVATRSLLIVLRRVCILRRRMVHQLLSLIVRLSTVIWIMRMAFKLAFAHYRR